LAPAGGPLSQSDRPRVGELLGREPRGDFEVTVRARDGDPVVIRNAPLLHDGTPMPTRYWLVGRAERLAVDRLEAAGGVRRAEAAVPAEDLRAAHLAYAAERDAVLPPDWAGPRPAGGVAGTRQGVKCLHAHYAWFLAGGPDPVGRWVDEQLAGAWGGASPGPAAAIDCGTNSTRLLVAHPGGPAQSRLMRITRLGQGVDRTHTLAPDAVERTLVVLREYRAVMDRLGVGAVRMTATSAARDAVNRDQFFAAAETIVGVRPELLGGDEEGRLSFAGATGDLDPSSAPWLVVDIGGGSTELVVGPGRDGGPRAVQSLDIGCVRITERFFQRDPPDPEEMAAARRFVDEALHRAVDAAPALMEGATMVGLAGTVAAMAAVDQGLDDYDQDRLHHYWLSRERVGVILDALATTDSAGRAGMPGIEPERADVIVGGALILLAVMEHFETPECLTSEADILDGLVRSLGRGLRTV
jgi:exopolyphosphatase/guanosine-5'-triphosphate,3'-diphosphate pyrophosphatase